jgi:hypothetical protein
MASVFTASQAAAVLHKVAHMADYRITHSRKDSSDADRRLDGFLIEGRYYDIDQVISWISKREHRFWVTAQNRSVWVEVRQHSHSGRQFLTTEGDGFPPNNLLNLPDC